MDRMFINGEMYRFEDADSGIVATVKVESDRIVFIRAENEAGEPLRLTPEQVAETETTAAAKIKAGELRPLHEDER